MKERGECPDETSEEITLFTLHTHIVFQGSSAYEGTFEGHKTPVRTNVGDTGP